MDFFAGSGSAGHAALELAVETEERRPFICVQLPEPTAEGSEERKAGFATIAEIAKERVRRVGAKLKKELLSKKADLGFRVFKLDQSNFTTWDAGIPHDSAVLERQLELHIEHIRDGRTDDDILYEILLKSWTSALTVPVEKQTLAGKMVYNIAEGLFIICLERELTLDLIRAIADLKPERVTLLDAGFAGNDQLKANAVQIFKTKGVTSFKTV
jgi:adenine-specific DNA-methyltransferase